MSLLPSYPGPDAIERDLFQIWDVIEALRETAGPAATQRAVKACLTTLTDLQRDVNAAAERAHAKARSSSKGARQRAAKRRQRRAA